MHFLGLDYGAKRWGLSFGDELGLALPLPAAVAPTEKARFAHVAREIAARKITELVVGYPFNMDGTVGFKAKEVDAFIAELEQRFKLPVHRTDERLTTHAAENQNPAKSKKHSQTPAARRAARATGELDSRAAAIILQDFLDTRNGPALLPEED
ncbi:MAG TPA: Holliday junction resolvase RuvX [Opitutales bacterium]|jgi:putative Holliday junction resolvase|nr:Holliday junction resolvase RuvX [Opitutales bacterium]